MGRKVELELEFQNYIENPPVKPKDLYTQACSNDGVTIDSWRKIWVDNVKANRAKFGPFKDKSLGKLHGTLKHKPAVIAGAGPSLKHNAKDLANRDGMTLISCLHNFHFLEDSGVSADYYVTLDAGEVTVEEVYEGGKKTPDEYWAMTKGKKLIAFIGSNPKLLEKWQGEILFYNAPVPDKDYMDEINAIDPFNMWISNGGNVLGACFYIAKGVMGANPIAFIGADFAFSYDKKFHGWDSKYDANMGNVLWGVDVYGNRIYTWASYHNFKCWFDYICMKVPGIYVNCTEGGTLGAYREGNLMAIRQMGLNDFFGMYGMHNSISEQCLTPEKESNRILF